MSVNRRFKCHPEDPVVIDEVPDGILMERGVFLSWPPRAVWLALKAVMCSAPEDFQSNKFVNAKRKRKNWHAEVAPVRITHCDETLTLLQMEVAIGSPGLFDSEAQLRVQPGGIDGTRLVFSSISPAGVEFDEVKRRMGQIAQKAFDAIRNHLRRMQETE